jgi:hypothetical protein
MTIAFGELELGVQLIAVAQRRINTSFARRLVDVCMRPGRPRILVAA